MRCGHVVVPTCWHYMWGDCTPLKLAQVFSCMYWRASADVVLYASTWGRANSPMTICKCFYGTWCTRHLCSGSQVQYGCAPRMALYASPPCMRSTPTCVMVHSFQRRACQQAAVPCVLQPAAGLVVWTAALQAQSMSGSLRYAQARGRAALAHVVGSCHDDEALLCTTMSSRAALCAARQALAALRAWTLLGKGATQVRTGRVVSTSCSLHA
jgi:hypothetical protein